MIEIDTHEMRMRFPSIIEGGCLTHLPVTPGSPVEGRSVEFESLSERSRRRGFRAWLSRLPREKARVLVLSLSPLLAERDVSMTAHYTAATYTLHRHGQLPLKRRKKLLCDAYQF